jgi:geranylgeranylglycerol-phosphate geranylgeranyltransferase
MTWTARALIRITRPHNCVAAGLAAMLGIYLSAGLVALGTGTSAVAAVTVAMVVAVGNITNDLRDCDVDRLQKAARPLPSGQLSPRSARAFAFVLGTAALGLGATFNAGLTLFVVGAMSLGIAYSIWLKRTVLVGNAAVAALSASTIVFGALTAGRLTADAGFAAGMVFWFMLGREILKDIADREGDRALQIETVATRLGPTTSFRILAVALVAWTAVTVLPWMLGVAPAAYLVAMCLLALVPTVAVVAWVSLDPTEHNLSTALAVTKLAWFGGLVAMMLLR